MKEEPRALLPRMRIRSGSQSEKTYTKHENNLVISILSTTFMLKIRFFYPKGVKIIFIEQERNIIFSCEFYFKKFMLKI